MKVVSCALLVTAALASFSAAAQQTEGNWMVRFRATNLNMDNKSDAGSGALTPALLPADAVKANDKTIPEVDITYFIAPSWAAELVLTIPQKQTLRITNGPLAEPIGSFRHLPPTLLLQYHFNPTGELRPYVGAGLNYTMISNVRVRSNIAGADMYLDSRSFGPAFQVGADYKLRDNWFLNVDLKKIYIDTDIKVGTTKSSHLNLDPVAFSVGVGKRF